MIDAAAKKPEMLVPIRVEVDTDTHRIRDCFTWNLNGARIVLLPANTPNGSTEDIITPNHFAQMFCSDMDLPMAHVDNIVNMIRAQLDEHSGVASMDVMADETDPDVEDPDCRVILRVS